MLTRSFSFLDVARSETPTDTHTRCPSWKVEERLPSSVDPFPPLRHAPSFSGPLRLLAVMGCSEWDRAQLCLAFLLSASLLA